MRIELKREGGLAFFPGLARPRSVDLDALPPATAEALQREVREARFFEQPATVGGGPTAGADRTSYTVTIEDDGGRRHSVRLVEPVQEPHLRALLGLLQQAEREQRAP
ncbi:protealysin inhibitor emfourin [Corallococcus sp. EGB]|uniref:protealysin inhibitor emfourin n=1 Tax=Corallococcus sp. EGB TaxID=1521117 RepID=UPI001CBA8F54|nr:protealysin inhibitor emfourin [Corallococcus sp. EGB]